MHDRSRWAWIACALLLTSLPATEAPGAASDLPQAWPEGIPSGAELEAAGAVIGRVRIHNEDVFDPSRPDESGWLYRTANKLHINTRRDVLRDQLLFRSGEPYVHRVIQETERLLRTNEYLYDAVVRPTAYDGRTVDLEVRTRDTWTLNPGVNFNRQGGENSGSIELEEKNLLGTGQQLSFGWANDVDRESLNFEFVDPHLHSTWTRLGLRYSDADDGDTKALRLDRPFYALDTRHAAGVYLYDTRFEDSRYAYGDRVGKFQQQQQFYEAYGGWSAGWKQGWVRRWTAGVTYDRERFAEVVDEPPGGPLPEDRTLVYPWIGFDILQDAYEERNNQDQIERTEDVLVGFRAGARLGYAAEAVGSDRDAWMLSAYAQDGFDFGNESSLFLGMTGSGRVEDAGLRDAVLSAEVRYYARTSDRTKFFATVGGSVTEALDAETQLLLGGDTGLRGYPLRYQAGTSLALFTLEERYYTNWYPFRLFHVAGAVFFDMGRTWGTDVTGATSDGLLKDVGVGLRLGSSRSAFGNVIHVDLAFPLDGGDDIDDVQFVVETKSRF
ncbi:MAG TPA: BamA/TamA family outer membrane protein [Steroidobacteraceae bacterium]|nr:BamA/TamA family outer membrane protein [Steroidobacteraceae bacterium]